tara:strand:+ start:7935 stop:8375 length:441 start_codon:yes stop_codon:yes gene_type:complete
MTTRPSREELAGKFFADMKNAVGADKEQSMAYNLIVQELIIRDLLGKFDEGWETNGPGILCLDLRKDRQSEYKTLEVVMDVADEAKAANDSDTHGLMTKMADAIKSLNFDKYGLVMRLDYGNCIITHIDRDDPVKEVKALIEQISS